MRFSSVGMTARLLKRQQAAALQSALRALPKRKLCSIEVDVSDFVGYVIEDDPIV